VGELMEYHFPNYHDEKVLVFPSPISIFIYFDPNFQQQPQHPSQLITNKKQLKTPEY
jgi:hypothetical protein